MKISATDRSALVSLIARFAGQPVLVLADLVADEFTYGEIARVSREAPVLILKQREREIVPGGGANAANNLLDLGARVTLVGAVGADAPGEALVQYFRQKGLSTSGILRLRDYQTPTKTRILGGLSHWQRQQIVRLDREPAAPLNPEVRARLARSLLPLVANARGLLVSDYGYGAVSAREVVALVRRARGKGLVTALDSRFCLLRYSGFTTATPNEPEIEAAFGATVGANSATLEQLAAEARRRMKLHALLVTRGRDGMVLFEKHRRPLWLTVFGSQTAVDVTGAGDTVIAVFTLALAAGADFVHAAQIANAAAGLAVMKRGTATVKTSELAEAIRNA